MGRLLPFKSEPTTTPDEPRVLDLEDEATEEALSALSSDTSRKILATLYEEPKTPPEIRDQVGTSLQNVHYHVERLEDAELIQPAGEGYSEKGTEMTIYAPASEALVLFAGREHHRSRLKTALKRLLGSVGLLAFASLVVRRLFGQSGSILGGFDVSMGSGSADSGSGGADGGDGADAGAAGGDGGDGGGDIVAEDADQPTESATPGDETGDLTGTETAAGDATATPTPEGTPTATSEPTVTIQQTQTQTPAGTPTPTDAATPTPTAEATPTPASTPTPTATPQATQTPTEMPTEEPTPSPTEAPSPTPEQTVMESGTASPATDTPVSTEAPETAQALADGGSEPLLADPAVAFFLGGLFMICLATAWWYWQS